MIAEIEDTIIAVVKSALGSTVREVKTIPGGWTLDALKRALQFSPGVYVAFIGAGKGTSDGYFNGRFMVYMVTKGASEAERRLGNARTIGAYEMLERLVPPLSILTVPDVGSAMVDGVDNLFRDVMFELGGTVYAIKLTVPNMPFDYQAEESGLDNFVLFHGEAYDEGGIDGEEDPLIVSEQQLHQ